MTGVLVPGPETTQRTRRLAGWATGVALLANFVAVISFILIYVGGYVALGLDRLVDPVVLRNLGLAVLALDFVWVAIYLATILLSRAGRLLGPDFLAAFEVGRFFPSASVSAAGFLVGLFLQFLPLLSPSISELRTSLPWTRFDFPFDVRKFELPSLTERKASDEIVLRNGKRSIEQTSTAPRTSAYWNTWFEYLDNPAPDVLTTGNTYTFTADISPFEYTLLREQTSVQSGVVDPAITELIADPNIKQFAFQIRPVLAEGAGLSFASLDQANTISMPANLERIRHPDLDEANRYVAGNTTLHELSDKVAAGNLRFKVRTDKAGCAAVVLAVFREDGLFPLDHLVRRVAIIDKPGDTPAPCDTDISGGYQQQVGGLANLLRVSTELGSAAGSQRAAAAFHIFDSKAGSYVVFADGRPGLQKSIYAWQTDSLVDYVSTPGRLPLLIDRARDAATNGTTGSYARAAKELADFIFGGRGSGEDEANHAKAAFQEIVAQSTTRPVILVRVVSDIKQGQNRSVFVPLGILGAKGKDADGKDAVLAQPITVIQPLPRERYGSACVKDWTFGLPLRLETIDRDLKWPSNTTGANSFHDLLGLKKYVSDPAPADGLPGQGFLLLAHNGNGNIWFDDQAERIIRQNVTRRFPSGSVGVFAACSLAPAAYDPGFVQQFNERGIDTLIASPFSVPAEYGIRLAFEFPKAVASLQSSKPTISELFAETLKQTADAFKTAGGKYEEMGLEYVLLGSPDIRLCDLPAANPDTGGKQ